MTLLVPLLAVIAIWWLGTGIVLYLQQRLASSRSSIAIALIVVGGASLVVLQLASAQTSASHSYAGLMAAVVLWGCIELSYYCGLITGTHKQPCPTSCSTTERFRLALGASLWHEISVLVTGTLLLAMLWGSPNLTGLLCFVVLWLMRWSAKLNLFFGVPNFSTAWFPERLAYVHTYIRRASVSFFFMATVTAAIIVAVQLLRHSLSVGFPLSLHTALPGVLLMLAILEHLFMAVPIADTELWNRIFGQDEVGAKNKASPTSVGSITFQPTDNPLK